MSVDGHRCGPLGESGGRLDRARCAIRSALDATGVASRDLWFDYLALTGEQPMVDVVEFIDGRGSLADHDLVVLQQAAIELLYGLDAEAAGEGASSSAGSEARGPDLAAIARELDDD